MKEDFSIKIGDPVQGVPPSTVETGKYAAVYQALDSLTNGEWLPVTFDTKMAAYNFRVSASTQRKRSVEVVLRGETVYIRNSANGHPRKRQATKKSNAKR